MQQRQWFAVLVVLVIAFVLTSTGLLYLAIDDSDYLSGSASAAPQEVYVPRTVPQTEVISEMNDPYKTSIVELRAHRSNNNDNDDDDSDDDNDEPGFDLTSGLGLHLMFDDANGSMSFVDSSPFGTAGVCSGTQCPTLTSQGRVNGAAFFDGHNDIVIVPNRVNIHASTSFTIASWVFIENFTEGWAGIASKIDGPVDCRTSTDCSNREYGVWVNSEGFIEFDITTLNNVGRSKISCYTQPGAVRAGDWQHIVAIADGAHESMKLYVNGHLQSECATPDLGYGLRDSDGPLMIGRMLNTTWGSITPLNGRLDDFRFYQNRVLDAAEVRALSRP